MSNTSKMRNMTKAKQNPPPIKKYLTVSINITDKIFNTYISFKWFEVGNKFNYDKYLLEVKGCLMDYKDTFLAHEGKDFKDLYSNNIKEGNFLSFFKTEEDNDCIIPCTEYNIKDTLNTAMIWENGYISITSSMGYNILLSNHLSKSFQIQKIEIKH